MNRRLLTMDTGENIGWALWDSASADPKEWPLLRSGSILRPRKVEWKLAVEWVIRQFSYELGSTLLQTEAHAVLEFPSYYESEGGRGAAVSGNLVKLAAAFGAEWSACLMCCRSAEHVAVNTWKGQLSKENTRRRVLRALPQLAQRKALGEHECDAIGIGLWKKGLL